MNNKQKDFIEIAEKFAIDAHEKTNHFYKNMKYIYFELHRYKYMDGSKKEECSIKNANVLLNKPHTNSGGVWGCTYMNVYKNSKGLPWYNHIIDQYWIDLEKYDFNATSKYAQRLNDADNKLIRDALEILNIT